MWIESHQTLRSHPKLKKFCRLTGVSEPCAIGHLHLLWWWALDYAPDGDLTGFDALDVAIGAGWDGDPDALADALMRAGFVESDDNGSRIHDWYDYAGKLIERRAKNAERMRHARATTDDERATHVQRTQRARAELPNRTVPNQTKPNQPSPVKRGEYSPDFETWFQDYPKGRGSKKVAFDLWQRLTVDERAAASQALPLFKQGDDWKRGFHPAPEVWLRGKRWENPPPPAPPDEKELIYRAFVNGAAAPPRMETR